MVMLKTAAADAKALPQVVEEYVMNPTAALATVTATAVLNVDETPGWNVDGVVKQTNATVSGRAGRDDLV